jgi:hypothetical protein
MKLQLLCFSVLKSCVCYYSMRFLWQCLKNIFAKYLTVTCLFFFSLSFSFSLYVCLSIYLLKLKPFRPELFKFGPAALKPKISLYGLGLVHYLVKAQARPSPKAYSRCLVTVTFAEVYLIFF